MISNKQRYYLGNIAVLAKTAPCDIGSDVCYPDSKNVLDPRDGVVRECRLHKVCGCAFAEITPQGVEFYGDNAQTTCNRVLTRQLDKILLERAHEVIRKFIDVYKDCSQLKETK